MNKHHQRPPAGFHSERRTARGFTLIEILVVLALTLVMMSMFATIFTMTGTFVTKQKGVGENDQSARILTTVLKTDLEARTMRLVVPFQPNTTVTLPIDTLRQGYFYYSENDPMNDQDDVLQFTIDLSKLPSTNPQHGGQLFGLATNLPLPWQSGVAYPAGALVRPTAQFGGTGFIYKNLTGGTLTSGGTEPNWNNTAPPGPVVTGTSTVTDAAQNWTVVPSAPDQPDGDDGRISYTANPVNQTINPANPANSSLPSTPDSTGASQLAEVCYFLRHGNLCRRVLLIRQPYDLGADTGSQPQDTGGAALILGVYPPVGYTTTNNFWTDFDYSARIQPVTGIAPATGVLLHGSAAPEASLINTNGATPNTFALGRPDNRFGFDQVFQQPGTPTATNGRPREYDSSTPPLFMGRYTHEETSNLNFLFPGNLPAGGSPMAQTTTATLDATGSFITQFQGGPRRGEDILLTNVIAFDVKILDPLYTEPTAPLTDLNRNGIIDGYISAGPPIVTTPTPAFVDLGHLGTTGCFSKAAQNATMIGYGPNPPLPTTNNVFDTWHPAFDFNGDTINDPPPYTGLPSVSGVIAWNTTWTASTAYSVGQVVAPPAASGIVNGLQYYCVTGGTTGTAMPFLNSDAPTNNYAPLQVLGTPIADGTVQWVAQTPVLAIQITVKYLDPTQNLLRQVTIVQTFALP